MESPVNDHSNLKYSQIGLLPNIDQKLSYFALTVYSDTKKN